MKTGAIKAYVDDLKEDFAKNYVFPAFRANVIYEGQYLLGTSIARPLIAKRQMEIAAMEGADAVSHGATGKGNDQVRFELGYYAINPDIKIIAPWRQWDLLSREKLMNYAEQHGLVPGLAPGHVEIALAGNPSLAAARARMVSGRSRPCPARARRAGRTNR